MSEMNNPPQTDQVIIPPYIPLNQPSNDNGNGNDDTGFSLDDYSEFAQGILSAIPENDRPTVGKYVKQWDGNVTKQFQRIHEQYQPYKDLGDIEDVQTALYYNSMLQNDPIEYIKTIMNACEEAGMSLDDLFPQGNGNEDDDGGSSSQGIPREFQQEMAQMKNMLGTMYSQFNSDLTARQEREAIAEFDNYLKDMHSRHGEFNDDWVSLQIERGVDPEDAIKSFKQEFPGYGSQNRRPAPSLISGNGTIRRDQANPVKMSDAERKAYSLQILMANRDE